MGAERCYSFRAHFRISSGSDISWLSGSCSSLDRWGLRKLFHHFYIILHKFTGNFRTPSRQSPVNWGSWPRHYPPWCWVGRWVPWPQLLLYLFHTQMVGGRCGPPPLLWLLLPRCAGCSASNHSLFNNLSINSNGWSTANSLTVRSYLEIKTIHRTKEDTY